VKITIGASAGHHFNGQADLTVVRHCSRGSEHGLMFTRKWLADRAAYNYDPRLGWAVDRWFEWDSDKSKSN
jgi:hypothetical protein